MAQSTTTFKVEGGLLVLWDAAQREFMESTAAVGRELKDQAEYLPNPGEWLKTFQTERHKRSTELSAACVKIGRHLQAIQVFVRVVGFSVNVASSAVPAASPASLVVNAFAWLFDSFIKVSDDYDKIEEFFGWIATRLEILSLIENFLKRQQKPGTLDKCIVNLFISCLSVCQVGSEQVKHRFKKWLQRIGSDKLDPELDKLKKADEALRFCIGVKTLHAGMETQEATTRMEAKMEKLMSPNDLHEREEMLEWLSPLDSPKMHEKVKNQAPDVVRGGSWLLGSELFERWKTHNTNRIWYTGDPGAGKSVLASIIIDHLRLWAEDTSSHRKSVMVSYLYLSYTSQPDLTELLGSILRQFQANLDSHPKILEQFREYRRGGKHDNKVPRPSLKHIKQLLTQITENATAFIVVDALDEFDINSRPKLLQHLRDIQPDAKILVTSRILNHLKTLQEGFESSTIAAHDEDMDEYINSVIQNCPVLLSYPSFHPEIREQVKQKSGKMFIIVRLHMAAIAAVEVQAELERVLAKLPDSLDGAYRSTMERIKSQQEPRKARAMSTLGWVAYAQRLLSIRELQHALAIEESPEHFGEKCLRPGTEILSDCCGLLITDLDDMVRYVHKSAREFFDTTRAEEFPNFDKRMTLACVRYLSIPLLHPAPANSETRLLKSIKSMETDHPFIRYAGEYLHRHHRRVQNLQRDEDVLNAIQTLVSDDDIRILYSRLLFKLDAYDRSSKLLDDNNRSAIPRQRIKDPLQPIHIAVYLGNPEVVTRLINDEADVNILDPYGQSALTVALKCGLDVVAGILLSRGAEIDLMTKKGHVILLHAMERDYTKVIEQIIGGSRSDILDEGLLKILGIVYLILLAVLQELMALVTSLSLRSRPPTETTLDPSSSNSDFVQSPEFDSTLENYRRLLHYAYKGDVDGLLLLLDPSTSERIELALVSRDAERSDSDLSRSDADDSDSYYDRDPDDSYYYHDSDSDYDEFDSPVPSSSSVSSTHSVKNSSFDGGDAEVSNGEDVHDLNSPDSASEDGSHRSFSEDVIEGRCDDDGMPVFNADPAYKDDLEGSESGSEDEVRCDGSEGSATVHSDQPSQEREDMSEEDNNISRKESIGCPPKLDEIKTAFLRSACFLAAESGRHEVVDTFLKYGVSPDLKNFQGQSLLHRATARGDCRLVRLLLDKGAEVDQRDKNGRTALMANADVKRNEVLKLLIRRGADLDLTQREGCHELYEAAVFGATKVVKFFLEHDISPSITNNFGWTPLHGAAANGHRECVQLLLEKNANPSPISDTGLTPCDFIQSGNKHYDHILTGGKHYEAELVQARELSVEDRAWNKDEILHMLSKSGALTSDELMQEIGEEKFLHGEGGQFRHRGWQHDSWWDKHRGSMPWYSHKD